MKKNKLVLWQHCHSEKREKSRLSRDSKIGKILNNVVSNQSQKMEKLLLTPSEPNDSQTSESIISQTVSSSNEQLDTIKLAKKMYLSPNKLNESEMSKIISNAVSPGNEQIGASRPNGIKRGKISATERLDLLKSLDNGNFKELDNTTLDKLQYHKGKAFLYDYLTHDEYYLFKNAAKSHTPIELTPNGITQSFISNDTAKNTVRSLQKGEKGKLTQYIIEGVKGKIAVLRSIRLEQLQVLFRRGSQFRVSKTIEIDDYIKCEHYNVIYLKEI